MKGFGKNKTVSLAFHSPKVCAKRVQHTFWRDTKALEHKKMAQSLGFGTVDISWYVTLATVDT